ncbi:hypothetical protein [Sphingomonas rustica]|uniref:hypothetical protein n=1 Tax=Sphingomonas rustica TaxID=3103142 RepID=UPI003D15D863
MEGAREALPLTASGGCPAIDRQDRAGDLARGRAGEEGDRRRDGDQLRAARAVTLERLRTRLNEAVAAGELTPSVDVHALARFVQTVQNGMSILARDGASSEELREVAEVAMLSWDARTGR